MTYGEVNLLALLLRGNYVRITGEVLDYNWERVTDISPFKNPACVIPLTVISSCIRRNYIMVHCTNVYKATEFGRLEFNKHSHRVQKPTTIVVKRKTKGNTAFTDKELGWLND